MKTVGELPMFSYEGHFYDSLHRETRQKGNAISPITKPTQTQCRSNSYMNDVRPAFEFYRLLGQFPFHIKGSGETTTFRLCCFLTLYSMLIQGSMIVGGALVLKQRIEYIKNEEPLFGQVLVEATFLGVLVPLFMSPFANLLEYRKKAEYLSTWTEYQSHHEAVAGRTLYLNLRRQAVVQTVLTLIITFSVASFPFLTLKNVRPWHAIPFSYSVLCCMMNIGMWRLSGLAVVRAAKAQMEQLEHVLVKSEFGGGEKIADYRMLWLKLSKLTQEKGYSMGFTYGTQVGINIQQKLQQLSNKIPRHYIESRREVRFFIKTIVENPPTINFSGFVIVNRGLLTSLMSAMVTYLVVLIQFQMSTEPTAHTNETCNNSAT